MPPLPIPRCFVCRSSVPGPFPPPRPTPPKSSELLPGVIGRCPSMRAVEQITRKVATSGASVLILGETGTGKELIASAVHGLSRRSAGPFVKVNCGALSESLLESELFGHVRGAFTGAVANRTGRFEAANGGSIFLDEINSTTTTLQVKLLRVLQEKEFERVGATTSSRTDARIIAASNRDLRREVATERFREDLYWRLNVVPIVLPSLRERRDDIQALTTYFLDYYNIANDRLVAHYEPEVLEALRDYHWPGNVRELQNYIERAVVLAEGDEFTLDLLPPAVTSSDERLAAMPDPLIGPPTRGLSENHPSTEETAIYPPPNRGPMTVSTVLPVAGHVTPSGDSQGLIESVIRVGLAEADRDDEMYPAIVDRIERELIVQVLRECGGVQTKTATRLGINRNTLHKKMKQYRIEG